MANNNRCPRFELHIVPLVRLLDHDKMLAFTGLDLWDYSTVKSKSTEILNRIQNDMPLVAYGGLWPREWVEVFRRWIDTGFQRLDLGVPSMPYEATRSGGQVTLLGTTTLPHESYEAWLQPRLTENGPREFVHYWMPPDVAPVPPLTPRSVVFEEIVTFDPALPTIRVIDRNGANDVAITESFSPALRRLMAAPRSSIRGS